MRKETWRQWARKCVRASNCPTRLTRSALASLTGQDAVALDAIAACWELYGHARGDVVRETHVLDSVRCLLPLMQAHTRWIAQELIPFALEWEDRDVLWYRVTGERPRRADNVLVLGV